MSARDMKEKIEKALKSAFLENRDRRISGESMKLKEAHISTLHSFCLHLIQMQYNVSGLSPDMRTLGDIEMKLRLENVISSVLEAYYMAPDEDFRVVSTMLSTDKSNDGLLGAIRDLYYTAVASPDPQGFLEGKRDQYIDVDQVEGILAD